MIRECENRKKWADPRGGSLDRSTKKFLCFVIIIKKNFENRRRIKFKNEILINFLTHILTTKIQF